MNQLPYRLLLRFCLVLYHCLLQPAALLPRRNTARKEKLRVLITGTFYTDQWLSTHLRPLAASARVAGVTMVAGRQVPAMENVEAVYPPRWLHRLFGEVASRTIIFIWHALGFRYDVIGGFHFLLNGLVALLLAKATGCRSLYICGGGPREIEGGGFETENRIFGRLERADTAIERLLLAAVRHVDVVICMGHSAVDYFRSRGVPGRIEVVPGGFDGRDFFPAGEGQEPRFDLILVGRLSGVKKVDVFVDAVSRARQTMPGISAVVVGDGPDREALERRARQRRIDDAITFAGWQQDVAGWLRQSRVFVLTSESEGLSQALIQALMCGLPAIVSNVGDLSDLVQDGYNGLLIDEPAANNFARAFVSLLAEESRYDRFRLNAIRSTDEYRVENVAVTWERILFPTEWRQSASQPRARADENTKEPTNTQAR